jgi:hypothetical protein
MSEFKLLEHRTFSEVIEHTYLIQYGVDKIVYKEWVDNGSVIDFTLTDEIGEDVGDEELMERVMEFVDLINR